MLNMLGYDFSDEEKMNWLKETELIVDDVPVVRRSRQISQLDGVRYSVGDENQMYLMGFDRRQCYSLQPDSIAQDNVSLCSLISEPHPLDERDEDDPTHCKPPLTSNSRSSSISAGSTTRIASARKRLLKLARKNLKIPFVHSRRMSEPVGMTDDMIMGGHNNNQLVQRCVIITRDDVGYGLTVSGDNPVFVQSVKEDGAAARAGVRQGDRIIKVNGTLVTGANHMDVVKMISSGTYVALTLLGRSPVAFTGTQQRPVSLSHQTSADQLFPIYQMVSEQAISAATVSTFPPVLHHSTAPSAPNHHHLQYVGSPPSTSSGSASSPSPCGSSASSGGGVRRSATTVGSCLPAAPVDSGKEFITGPRPVDEEKQAEWKKKRIQIIQQMLEEEKKHIEELRSGSKSHPNDEKTQQLFEQAQKRIRNLENQLSDFRTSMASGGSGVDSKVPSSNVRKKEQGESLITPGSLTKPSAGAATKVHQSISVERVVESTDRGPPSSLVADESAKDQEIHFITPAQIDVVPMEESDSDTETAAPLDTEGPFSNFAELKGRPAHLAVFLHYLISNSDPASLLFYLVTDLYSQGGTKDLRKWAYEIHSSFLVPTAPLRVFCIDNDVWQDVESVLNSAAAFEQEDAMKRLFVRARQKALDEISEHLADFRNKRTLGLGNVFGESMLQGLVYGDFVREKKIVDALLSQHFEMFFNGVSDFDSLPDRIQVLAASLATILRHMGVKPSVSLHEKLLDKCPSYVAKEKKGFARPLLPKPSKKAVQVKGHHFLLVPVFSSTKCYQCSEMVWGVNAQAYFCSNCEVVVHKHCAGSLEDACGGSSYKRTGSTIVHPANKRAAAAQKKPGAQLSNGSTVPTPTPSSVPIPVPKTTTCRPAIVEEPEDGSVHESLPIGSSSMPNHYNTHMSAADLEELGDCPSELPCSPPICIGVDGMSNWLSKPAWSSADSGYGGESNLTVTGNNAASIIGRSQSMRSRDEQVRKRSSTDSSGRRTKSDVDADDKSIAMAKVVMGSTIMDQQQTAVTTTDVSTCSSTSSVGRNSFIESPSISTEALRRPIHSSSALLPPQPHHLTTVTSSPQLASTPGSDTLVAAPGTITLAGSDSDLEAETECPLLEEFLDWETIRHLKPKEKKRQEVINELFHTERTHVRNLKVLHRLFYERLLAFQILPPDFIKLLFANIEDILDLHTKLNTAMKAMTKKSKLVGDIGELMLACLDGDAGDHFRRAAATFCQHQQYALEALKLRQKKDQKLAQFLQEAEGSSVCRKLQLKDMLPMEMQRLTKYPLLIETVAKYTPESGEEADRLRKCVECARAILDMVNTAKRNSENLRRLEDLQRRLDTSSFDKVQHPMVQDYRVLDLRQYSLVHDAPLTWRLGKNKAVDLHVVLLEDLLVLLTRNSDGQKLSLRFHNITFTSGKEDTKFTHCPVLKLSSLMAKNVATDKKAFFLVSTSALGPQIYELVAQSTADKKTWFKFITEQIDACKRAEEAAYGPARLPTAASANVLSSSMTKTSADSIGQNANANSQSEPANVSETARKLSEAGLTLSAAAAAHVDDELAPVERVQIISQPRLINPSEVLVCQPTVLEHAEPVLTPLERLRRKDEAIMRALIDKQKILAKIFHLPTDDLERVTELVMDTKSANKEARELALASIVQTNRLLEAINASMKLQQEEEKAAREGNSNVAETRGTSTTAAAPTLHLIAADKPAVPCSKLTLIAAPLMKHLTGLLHSLQAMEDDLKRVRQELHLCKERIGESSENNSPAGSIKKPSSTPSSVGNENGRPGVRAGDNMKKAVSQPPPTTDIDDYLASNSGNTEQQDLPKLTVERCSRTKSDERPGSGGSLGSGSSAKSSTVSPLSSVPSPEPRSSSAIPIRAAPGTEKSVGISPSHDKITAGTPDRSASHSPARPGRENPPKSLHVQNTRKEQATSATSSSHNSVKSPESSGEGDEEKRREKRRQKRQRHTALSGLETGSQRRGSSDSTDLNRKTSLDEEDDCTTSPSAESPAKAISESKDKKG